MDLQIPRLKLTLISLLIIVGLLVSLDVSAQKDFQGKWEFSGYLGYTSIDEDIAAQNFIEDDALSIGFSADYDHGQWLSSLGAEFVSYSDNAGFSQFTEGVFGGVEVSDSSADGFLFSLATGPAWHFSDQRVMLYVQAGVSVMLGSERSISNCSSCAQEDIDVDGGFFAKVGAVKTLQRVSFGLHAVNYFSDEGIDNAVQLSIGTAY